ncbi:hypothetical protein Poly51_52500 [Rubripirellula tenax]|uniref:Uncharacterized protein n=1 Tax=Rubripirellula tenax TaxID=2528015 RepID=A0A5C6EFT2_9BACT|nr:hypothetical protein [Rubripirellula tenax]TWU47450.1 hypothetical protein Poly51_52500 [Rubripirellula tenax]
MKLETTTRETTAFKKHARNNRIFTHVKEDIPVQSQNIQSGPGTVLWIGERQAIDFQAAYQFCENRSSQLAWRADMPSAIERPAQNVSLTVFAQHTRQPPATELLEQLLAIYPDSTRVNLLGVLCEAITRTPMIGFDGSRHPWHRWNQVLTDLLDKSNDPSDIRSVLIMSADVSAAQTLLDLADEGGATAVWSRTMDPPGIRNVDAVWWDDSIAGPATAQRWADRAAKVSSAKGHLKQAWLVNSPRPRDLKHAQQGGVDMVLSKPHRIEPLLRMIEASAATRFRSTETKVRVA